MPPPPLPYIDAPDIVDGLRKRTGDALLVREVASALRENTKATYDAHWKKGLTIYGTPPPAFFKDSRPGSPDQPLSPAAAQALFEELAAIKDIPFDFPFDGCFARAHEMCRILTERGIASAKVWNFAAPQKLTVESQEWRTTVEWGYHVAPIVCVRGDDGVTRPMVFDPSTNRERPVTTEEWQGKQGGGGGGQRLETTDPRPYWYHPADMNDRGRRFGTMMLDPEYKGTRLTIEHMTVQRDLARRGL